MLKALLAIVIIAALAFGGWLVYSEWVEVKEKQREGAPKEVAAAAPVQEDNSSIPGLPQQLEGELAAAKAKGAPGLKIFLTRYSKVLRDPRLASIELEYVLLVAPQDVAEAKKYFARVKKRTPPASPVYSRIKQLEKTYE